MKSVIIAADLACRLPAGGNCQPGTRGYSCGSRLDSPCAPSAARLEAALLDGQAVQTGIFDGNGTAVGDGRQQREVIALEDAGTQAVIHVNDAQYGIFVLKTHRMARSPMAMMLLRMLKRSSAMASLVRTGWPSCNSFSMTERETWELGSSGSPAPGRGQREGRFAV